MCKLTQMLTIMIVMMTGGYPVTSAARPQSVPVVYLESRDAFAREFQAAVARKDAPVTFSDHLESADYIATLDWEVREASTKWGLVTLAVFGVYVYVDGSYEIVSLRMVERQSGNEVFHFSCLRTSEETRTAANCLARHWRKALVHQKTKMARPQTRSSVSENVD
jgi:hypothetical protein